MSDAVHPSRAALVSNPIPTPTPKDTDRKRSRSRSRSRSPRGSPPRAPRPKNYTGLKWKKSERSDADKDDDRRGGYDRDRRDNRSYRSRDDRGDDRRGDRRDDRRSDRRDDGRDYRRSDRRDDDRRRDRDPERRRERDSERQQDRSRREADRNADRRQGDRDRERASKPAAPAAAAPSTAAPGEPMIMVTVNDRLGTKAQIPCFASDPVKAFKMMVAAKIGRPVHEIMLKRQGERPFHDQLSLADYGVSNGVQIDLELNTGD